MYPILAEIRQLYGRRRTIRPLNYAREFVCVDDEVPVDGWFVCLHRSYTHKLSDELHLYFAQVRPDDRIIRL
jgi:hypothetical protein